MKGWRARTGLLIILSLSIVAQASAQVINEVMYDPSGTDNKREWVEIYNNTPGALDISTYKFLEKEDASNHGLTLVQGNASVPAGGYALLVADLASFLSSWSFSGPVFKIGSVTSLNNTGSTLILKDANLAEADRYTYMSGQGGSDDGNSLSRQSDGGFLAAEPTPGAVNSSVASVSTPAGGSSSTSTATTTEDTQHNDNAAAAVTSIVSSHYSFVPISNWNANEKYKVSAGRDRLGVVGVPMEFKALANTVDPNASYFWNFGDGSTAQGRDALHTYAYPGAYVVVLDSTLLDNEAVSRVSVRVVDPQIRIAQIRSDAVIVANDSAFEVNLFGWQLRQGRDVFDFPKDTIIPGGGSVTIAVRTIGFSPDGAGRFALAKSGDPLDAGRVAPTPPSTLTQESIEEVALKLSHAEKELYDMLTTEASAATTTYNVESHNTASVAAALPQQVHSAWLTTLKHFFGFK